MNILFFCQYFLNHYTCFNSLPRISPTPMNIPDIPMRPLALSPNCGVLEIQVPYTPLKKVSSIPVKTEIITNRGF